MRTISRPVLQGLRDETGETVNLGILDGQDVFYLDVVQSRHPFRMVTRIGTSRPLYCTAMGKVLTALLPENEKERVLRSLRFERFTPYTITQLAKLREELEKTRQRGYALDDEEGTLGARCVSVPILLEGNRLTAAVSVAGPTTRIARDRVPFYVEAVQNAARTISERLSGSGLQ
jgi:DNA-binding IclR family transcriptional regulator